MNPGFSIVVDAGDGWGTGAHETTQLCLQAIAMYAPELASPWRVLDFGSGSGILSIGAAKLGATVHGVEIDERGIAHAKQNSRMNSVSDRVEFTGELSPLSTRYEIVVANILRSVLLGFAESLCQRLTSQGVLILSGLVSTDVPEVSVRYSSFLNGQMPEVFRRGEWRALVWPRANSR